MVRATASVGLLAYQPAHAARSSHSEIMTASAWPLGCDCLCQPTSIQQSYTLLALSTDIAVLTLKSVSFLPRNAVKSAVLLLHLVCQYVCLSVCLLAKHLRSS